MKNLIFVLLVLFGLSSCDKETVMPDSKVPSEINSYVQTHFPDYKVLQVIKELDDLKKTYEVYLEGSFKLEFNRNKQIISLESQTGLPNSVIPEKILTYVQTNYPSNFIKEWELDDLGQEVRLDNKMELKFNKSGDFLRID